MVIVPFSVPDGREQPRMFRAVRIPDHARHLGDLIGESEEFLDAEVRRQRPIRQENASARTDRQFKFYIVSTDGWHSVLLGATETNCSADVSGADSR